MLITNSYIQAAVTLGSEYATQGWSEYCAKRKKGKVCQKELIEFGVLFAFIKAIDGYDVDNESAFCITGFQAAQIAEGIEDLAFLLNSTPVSFETYNILTEDGNDMMTEDGDNLIWI